MSTLLNIPREIRQDIIHHVLTATRYAAPQNVTYGPLVTEKDAESPAFKALESANRIYVPPHRSNAIHLLHVNRQLRHETQLEAQTSRSSIYKIQVLILQEAQVWQRATSLPTLFSTAIHTIDLTFHLHGSRTYIDTHSVFDYKAPTHHNEAYMAWSVMSLLEHLVTAGPVRIQAPGAESTLVDRAISIDNLSIDVRTPVDVPTGFEIAHAADTIDEFLKGFAYSLRRGKMYMMSARALADFIAGIVRALGAYKGMIGSLLHERVGVLVIKVDGEVCEEVELAGKVREVRKVDVEERAAVRSSFWRHTGGYADREGRFARLEGRGGGRGRFKRCL